MKKSIRIRKLTSLCALLIAMCILMTAGILSACQPAEPTSGEEVGVYYYQPTEQSREDIVTLSDGLRFTYSIGDDFKSGTYMLKDGALTLTCGEETISATLEKGAISLEYNGTEMKFLKKIYYTVTFDTVGGSAFDSVEVLNGKTLKKPDSDPAKDGNIFLGWYQDSDCNIPYVFGAHPVTEDITLYARWAQYDADAKEYTVSFVSEHGDKSESVQTIGGKLYDLPQLQCDGYKFVGWWMSMYDEADKLTSAVKASSDGSDGTSFTSDTTLFAVWQSADVQTASPAVSVEAGAVSWDSVGSAAYLLTITAPDGTAVYKDYRTTTTTFPYTFEQTGEYKVEVTAINAGGSAVSDTTVRYYVNNALNRVSGVKVMEPSILVFGAVENAEEYIITIECGDELHTHSMYSNGTSLYYNFENCKMKQGGIEFTITAVADGYASSQTKFTFERNLDAVANVSVKDDILTWNAVQGAGYYLVNTGSETLPVFGTQFSLKNLTAGKYTFEVTAFADGYNSAPATSFVYDKTTLALPESIRLTDKLLSWTEGEADASYQIIIDGKAVDVEEGALSYDLAPLFSWSDGETYTLQLKVVKGNAFAISDEFQFISSEMGADVSYEAGVLSWKPVAGATSYEVMLNGKLVATVTDGSSSIEFQSLASSGLNTFEVRFVKDGYVSEWESTTVTAHKIALYVGESALEPQYKAVGDPIVLPEPESPVGREFYAWYNTPNGPESNGAMYDEPFFIGPYELVLYAYFRPMTYNVTFADSDGIADAQVKYGGDYTFEVPVSDDATQVFGGWYSAPNGNGYAYTDANGKSLTAWSVADDVTVYPYWIDSALSFTLAGNSYIVSSGPRINMVESVTVPSTYNGITVSALSSSAFVGCSTLKEINIPDTLQSVANSAFEGCTSLVAVNVYDAGSLNVRYSSSDGILFDSGLADDRHAPRVAFVPSAKTGTYTIPYGVDVITRQSFANSKISKVVIPVSVISIETEAFAECTNLSSVVFENPGASGTLTIGDRVFKNCTALTTLTLPARLTKISLQKFDEKLGDDFISVVNLMEFAPDAFYGCDKLASVSIAQSANSVYTSLDGVLLADNGRTLVYFPAGKSVSNYQLPATVTAIGEGAFVDSGISGTLTLPARVTSIGRFAFAGTRIGKLVFGGNGLSKVTVGEYAFYGCSSLWSVQFEENSLVSVLGKGAFKECEYLEEFNVPASMTEIGEQAFYYEYDSEYDRIEFDITFAETTQPLVLGDKLFYGREFYTLTIPANAIVTQGVLAGVSFEDLEVDADNASLASIDHMDGEGEKVGTAIYLKDSEGVNTTLLMYIPDGNNSGLSFDVPDGVKTIASGAFANNESLSTVTIPSSVTLIDERAFYNSELENIVFDNDGDEKLTIGAGAFYGSYSGVPITSLVLPDREVVIGAEAFSENGDLVTLDLGGTTVIGDRAFAETGDDLQLVIPKTVKTIGFEAFAASSYNGIVSLTFEADSKLSEIGTYAFADSKITSVTVPASVESVGASAFRDTDLTELNFEEGELPLVFGKAYDGGTGNVIYGTKIAQINFPGRLTELADYALAVAYTSADPSPVTVTFGSQAGELFAESRLTTIGAYAFENLGLTSVIIPKSVQNTDVIAIGNNAFDYCRILTSVTFEQGGSGTLTIGENAFVSCKKLQSIVLPANLGNFTSADGTVIPALANGVGVFLPSYGTTDTMLESIDVASGNSIYASKDGVLYTGDYSQLIFCPPAKSGTVTVDKRAETIGQKAFLSCAKITEVKFEEDSQCKEILSNAFEGCSALTDITLPDSLETIGDDAFIKCPKLTKLQLPASFRQFSAEFLTDYITEITVSEDSQYYKSTDSVLYSKDGTVLVYSMSTIADYVVPEGTLKIAEGAFGGSIATLQSVSLPSTLTEIGASAFARCSLLSNVNFADGGSEALVIGDSAFNATAVTSIDLPARTLSIGSDVFYFTSLASVTFGADSQLTSIGSRSFMGTAITSLVLPESVIELGDNVFYNCYQLKTVRAEGSLVKMGSSVFAVNSAGTSSLTSVVLPATLKTIGEKTFMNCDLLRSVTFGENSQLEVLPFNTFYGCVALESFEIPAGITVLEGRDPEYTSVNADNTGLFQNLTSLKKVTFAADSKCIEIGQSAFEGSALESFEIPASVTRIGGSAFAYANIGEIVIPKTVTSIGTFLFSNCKQLTSARIEASVDTLPNSTFQDCTFLQDVYLSATVKEIVSTAFNGCSSLESIDIDKSNTAFTADEDGVLFNTSKTKIVFLPASLQSITIPANLADEAMLDMLKAHSNLATIEVEAGNPLFVSYCGALYTNGEDGLALAVVPKAMATFTIPKEIDLFYGYGLFGGTQVTEVNYEERTTDLNLYGTMGSGAFTNAKSLVKVTLPANTVIGAYAFRGCISLETVILQTGTKGTIGNYAFADTALTSLTITEGYTSMGNNVFDNTPLETLHLPTTMASLSTSTFTNASDLKSITVEAGNTALIVEEGVLYSADKTNVYFLPADLTEFEIPVGASSQMISLLKNLPMLQLVTVAQGNTSYNVKFGALYDSKWNLLLVPRAMTEFKIPVELKEIDGYDKLFNGCAVTTVTYEDGRTDALSLTGTYSYGAFYGANGIVQLNLPEGTRLDNYALSNMTSLKKFVIPAGAYVGDSAFYYWTSDQTLVLPFVSGVDPVTDSTYGWNSSWDYNCNAVMEYAEQ